MSERRFALSGFRNAKVMAIALSLSWTTARVAAAAPIKVACIGEHTTHSDLYSNDREHQPAGMQEYPLKLQALLGSGYDVRNFGDCCASIVQGYTTSETHPFVSGQWLKTSISFAPDVVVIGSWGRHDWGLSAQNAFAVFTIAKFQTDYDDLVSRYRKLTNPPKIYCSTPIPILFGEDGPDRGHDTSSAATAIKTVCGKYGLPIIDLFTTFLHHKEYFIQAPAKDSEGEHLNDSGLQKIAQVVHDALTSPTSGGTDAGATPRDASTSISQDDGGVDMELDAASTASDDAGTSVTGGGVGGSGGSSGTGGAGGAGGLDNTGGGTNAGTGGTGTAGNTSAGGAGTSTSTVTKDAGSPMDVPATPPGNEGCSCRVTGGPSTSTSGLLTGIVIFGLFLARQKRREPSPTGPSIGRNGTLGRCRAATRRYLSYAQRLCAAQLPPSRLWRLRSRRRADTSISNGKHRPSVLTSTK